MGPFNTAVLLAEHMMRRTNFPENAIRIVRLTEQRRGADLSVGYFGECSRGQESAGGGVSGSQHALPPLFRINRQIQMHSMFAEANAAKQCVVWCAVEYMREPDLERSS